MKKILLVFLLFTGLYSCKKNTSNCTNATVTLKATNCKHVGVIIGKTTYPTDNLPNMYAIEGKNICIEYSLYDDPKMCMCCGGTYVHIINVH